MHIRPLPALALFVGLSAIVYAPSLHAPFVYDSEILRNASLLHITSLDQLPGVLFASGVPRRVGLASFALNFYAGGLEPFGYHLVNLLIHALNGFVFYLLLARLLSLGASEETSRTARPLALVSSLLWLVHPVQTQAVSYVYQRFTSLSSLFFLGALTLYLSARTSRTRARWLFFAGAGISALLALGTKENAGTLPLFIVLIELLLLGGLERERRSLVTILAGFGVFALVATVYLGPRFVAMIAGDFERRGFTLEERLLTESRVVFHYLGLLAFPHPSRLQLDYDFPLSTSIVSPPTTLAAIVAIGLALAASIRWARSRPLLSFGIFWYFGNLAVESTFIPLDLVYEHRLYVPGMAPVALVVGAAVVFARRRASSPWLWMAPILVAGTVWSYWTYERNRMWADPVRLFEQDAVRAQNKARVQANLGKAYLARGDAEDARAAFERALALAPHMSGAAVSLANIELDFGGDLERAEETLRAVLEREPGFAPAQLSQGLVHLRRRELPEAIARFERVLELDRSSEAGHYNLGAAHFNAGDFDEAIEILEQGAVYWPASAKIHALLGAALAEAGAMERADEALARALELDPGNDLARRYRARTPFR